MILCRKVCRNGRAAVQHASANRPVRLGRARSGSGQHSKTATYIEISRISRRKALDQLFRHEPGEESVTLPFQTPVGAQLVSLPHERVEVVQLISWQRTFVRQGELEGRPVENGRQRRQAVRAKDEVGFAPFGRWR